MCSLLRVGALQGTQAQTFVIAPLGWRPDLRDRLIDEFRLPKDTQRIDAPTPYVSIIGRIDPIDRDATRFTGSSRSKYAPCLDGAKRLNQFHLSLIHRWT